MRPTLRALALIDRSDLGRRVVTGAAARLAVTRGADRQMIEDVVDSGLPIDRTLQAFQWTLAASGCGDPPRHFQPGDHFSDPGTRRRAARLARLAGDDRFVHGLIGVDDDAHDEKLADLVRGDLARALAEAARAPGHRRGIDPAVQLDCARRVTDALEREGIRPFLMSGSLLGIVRDGGFMPHDYDVDLGLLPGTDPDRVRLALDTVDGAAVEREGRRTVVRFGRTVVDVFDHEERDGRWWHSTLIHEWWNTPFGLRSEEVTGEGFAIPDDPELYLTENYGDWSRPVPFYEISFDTPNRVYLRNAEALRFLHSRVRIGLRRGDRWLVESAARELRDAFGVDVTHLLATSSLTSPPDPAPTSPPEHPVDDPG